MDPIIVTILVALAAALARNVAGWLENAMKDGIIPPYEWGELGATSFRIVILTVGTQYGLGLEPLAAGGSAVVLDFILKAFKATPALSTAAKKKK